MPLIQFAQVMTANGTAEPLSGSQYEYLPWPAQVEIAMNCSAAAQVVATVSSGAETLQEEATVQVVTTASVPPPFDQAQLMDIAAAGDRLKIRLRETAAATPTVFGWVRITPLV
jgi:hypothetical protein